MVVVAPLELEAVAAVTGEDVVFAMGIEAEGALTGDELPELAEPKAADGAGALLGAAGVITISGTSSSGIHTSPPMSALPSCGPEPVVVLDPEGDEVLLFPDGGEVPVGTSVLL